MSLTNLDHASTANIIAFLAENSSTEMKNDYNWRISQQKTYCAIYSHLTVADAFCLTTERFLHGFQHFRRVQGIFSV